MSTYSTTLRLELIGAGEQDGTWGDTTNSNLGDLIEAAITNVADINFIDANYTLSANNGLPDEARNAVLNLAGTNSAQRNLIAPAVEKTYIIKNGTGANVSITTNGAGANVVVQNGETKQVFCDGTNFYESLTNVTNATRITNPGGWSITPSGTTLFFNYNGSNVASLTSTGNLTVIGNVVAFGSV
jgi:hypothetical protein